MVLQGTHTAGLPTQGALTLIIIPSPPHPPPTCSQQLVHLLSYAPPCHWPSSIHSSPVLSMTVPPLSTQPFLSLSDTYPSLPMADDLSASHSMHILPLHLSLSIPFVLQHLLCRLLHGSVLTRQPNVFSIHPVTSIIMSLYPTVHVRCTNLPLFSVFHLFCPFLPVTSLGCSKPTHASPPPHPATYT